MSNYPRRMQARELILSLLFLLLTSIYPNTSQAQWRSAVTQGITQTPPLQLKNLAGQDFNLSTYKGKVIIVNFWASWCEPCREEFDELIYLQEKYAAKGLKVVAVNLGEMKPRITQFLKGSGITENAIEILQDRNSTIYKTWKARGIPTSFLVGKNGKIESVWIGSIDNADSDEVKAKIEALLRQ